jgi:uncharacterized membrane protein YphA (DoxX/SURF4 family)
LTGPVLDWSAALLALLVIAGLWTPAAATLIAIYQASIAVSHHFAQWPSPNSVTGDLLGHARSWRVVGGRSPFRPEGLQKSR